ncbi:MULTISPECIES: DUF2715 domain-containing protein [unclassified Treponema]|uniref:DUF2715 domain-containing protein n=1 Tax=unclassified Treponema TaxID=2638727 RepID=UPI0020A34A88|nr:MULTISPECIES: DUF2715 domain-containing protein [unclassified Treponema]UTC67150.1 DUF2715 domain-containing protein [Treponema sp. OMZ 789]UTC69880.1 DUF2715 domain-containing protein [Treponema sp. OMZ 790]UTC72595.1 DUF2715 domain-containing protein [Treponema sp. OMZ 791]
MKNKKMIFVFVMLAACIGFVFADFAISVGPAYTNYFTKSDTKVSFDAAYSSIQTALTDVKNEKNNAAGVALDLRAGLFYMMAQIAFPGKNHKALLSQAGNAKNFVSKNSVIFDSQLGAGLTLFKKSRFNLFLGGGLGLNAMKSTQTATILGQGISYEKLDVMFGLGANVLASFYFTDMIGIYAGIADTFYFAPLKVEKTFKIAGVADYVASHKNGKVGNVIANSLNLKLGLSLRF